MPEIGRAQKKTRIFEVWIRSFHFDYGNDPLKAGPLLCVRIRFKTYRTRFRPWQSFKVEKLTIMAVLSPISKAFVSSNCSPPEDILHSTNFPEVMIVFPWRRHTCGTDWQLSQQKMAALFVQLFPDRRHPSVAESNLQPVQSCGWVIFIRAFHSVPLSRRYVEIGL